MTIYHVATTGDDHAAGTAEAPFRTINTAAAAAQPGDTVRVHAGTYREWVKPVRGGLSDVRRIIFEAAPGEHVTIKGSERVTTWVHEAGTVWRAEIPNTVFGDFNPYAEAVDGDWIVPTAPGRRAHLGDVYLNGRSFFEATSRAEVLEPRRRTHARDIGLGIDVPVGDPDWTVYVWHAEVGTDVTTIWANFQGADPNAETVEINVRRSVFYPEQTHLDYITVRGFELAHAATPWTPPTADQPGLIGPNWAKGWIIEDNVIHDAKCSAISLGKERSTGHNFAHERNDKPGYQYQLESVFTARRAGWSRETVGSHVVRRNEIYDCGQNGIVGHLGCVYSVIEDNHIHHIGTKYEFHGHEIGGIKLHAPIDVAITHNRIHDTTLGIWLDWQTQGTRINRNVFYRNTRDLFVEVTHGPYTVDHNVFGSQIAFDNFAQGGAFVNNLIAGYVRHQQVLDRATPYHLPHSTELAGYAFTYGGDDRWIANVFATGGADRTIPQTHVGYEHAALGTCGYDRHPSSWGAYQESVGTPDDGDHSRFHNAPQAVYIRDNAYAGGATPFVGETGAVCSPSDATVAVTDDGDAVYLDLDLPAEVTGLAVKVTTGADLERVRVVDADYESPDGSPLVADTDLTGQRKDTGALYPAGPLAAVAPGATRVRIW